MSNLLDDRDLGKWNELLSEYAQENDSTRDELSDKQVLIFMCERFKDKPSAQNFRFLNRSMRKYQETYHDEIMREGY